MKVSDILKIATNEIGTVEYPSGSNKVKYNTWYYGREVSGSSYPWCMAFVQWVFNESGNKLPCVTAGCTTFMNYAKNNGNWITHSYQPGDIILYNFDNASDSEHVGICESANSTSVTCIEGNTGTVSQDNGGKVMRRTRSLSLVLGAYRPKYSDATNIVVAATNGGSVKVTVSLNMLKYGSKGTNVKALQILLNGKGCSCGAVDGEFGNQTLSAVKRFQSNSKIDTDGVVGAITWGKLLA